ncbi:hypothetical protein FRACYDRAFT_240594 [Fragilariopsis cylindrus CCMP1102]|uniref:DUF2834 domain-containing protein n=1 Tax=Fragilariopsis cylindrus CCMP1102 TaxID=635003 RepID=A0A1E7FCM3_9STRA|nr:hypothetical protein FRACYDRAFT_240594 [Fragilariopsis cylindrus CCMP1102]|eukprot:OEU15899.1 hypothetical protein FRACYDRAFT_240594 [Fragilariopsis cylindrus CCMP1102]
MMKQRSLLSFLAVVTVIGTTNGFTPQPQPFSMVSKSLSSSSSSSSLSAWNPFVKEDAGVAVVEVEKKVAPIPGPLNASNAVAGLVWVSLITWAFGFAPGTQINELWFAVWNCFAIVPAVLAALEAPVGRGQRLPAAPFLWGSAALGYFALGPYFITRTVRTEPVELDDLGWASRNIFENRIFGIVLSAIALSIPFTSDLFNCDIPATIAGFQDLASSSRFVSVASLDITIMSLIGANLVREDSIRRGWEDKSTALLIASIFLPVITPCLYLAARPSLEE